MWQTCCGRFNEFEELLEISIFSVSDHSCGTKNKQRFETRFKKSCGFCEISYFSARLSINIGVLHLNNRKKVDIKKKITMFQVGEIHKFVPNIFINGHDLSFHTHHFH